MKFKLIIICSLLFLCGCTKTITPRYQKINNLYKEELNDIEISVVAQEGRQDSKRYFINNMNMFRAWEENASRFNGSQMYFLSNPSTVLIKSALEQSLSDYGYNVVNRSDVVINCKIKKFLYKLGDARNLVTGEIEVNLSLQINNRILAQKTYSKKTKKPLNMFRQYEDAEPVLGKCLTELVTDIALDPALEDSLKIATEIIPETQYINNDLTQRNIQGSNGKIFLYGLEWQPGNKEINEQNLKALNEQAQRQGNPYRYELAMDYSDNIVIVEYAPDSIEELKKRIDSLPSTPTMAHPLLQQKILKEIAIYEITERGIGQDPKLLETRAVDKVNEYYREAWFIERQGSPIVYLIVLKEGFTSITEYKVYAL